MADGVSNTILPKFASRTAVGVALESMQQKEPSSEIIRVVHEAIQKVDLHSMVFNLLRFLREKQEKESNPLKQMRIQMYRTERYPFLKHSVYHC